MSGEADKLKPSALNAPVPVKPVKFIHREGSQLPTYHADGAWGALNQHGLIRIGFYAENPPTPTTVIQDVNPDGSARGEQKQIGADDPEYFVLVRDFQCNVVLPLTGAIQVYQMLGSFIKISQEQMKERVEEIKHKWVESEQKKSAPQT